MISHQAETQFIASQPFAVSVLGLIPSPYPPPLPMLVWKCQLQVMETKKVPEYLLQLGCQTLVTQDLPRISPQFMGDFPANNPPEIKKQLNKLILLIF